MNEPTKATANLAQTNIFRCPELGADKHVRLVSLDATTGKARVETVADDFHFDTSYDHLIPVDPAAALLELQLLHRDQATAKITALAMELFDQFETGEALHELALEVSAQFLKFAKDLQQTRPANGICSTNGSDE